MPLDGQIEHFTREPNETKPRTEAEVLSRKGLIRWLEKQVALGRGEETYCWVDAGTCLYHQFGVACGFPEATAYRIVAEWFSKNDFDVIGAGVALNRPHNFSAALKRALVLRSAASGREGK